MDILVVGSPKPIRLYILYNGFTSIHLPEQALHTTIMRPWINGHGDRERVIKQAVGNRKEYIGNLIGK